VKRKTTPGQPNSGNPLSKNKASYKTLVLTYPYAVVIPLTLPNQIFHLKGFFMDSFTVGPTPKIDLMCNPTRTIPNQIFHLKRFLMDSFTLGPTPKIDFTRTVEHTSAMA
jgi:hypothetical protein